MWNSHLYAEPVDKRYLDIIIPKCYISYTSLELYFHGMSLKIVPRNGREIEIGARKTETGIYRLKRKNGDS